MQGYQLGEGGERMGEEVQRISIIGRYKINGEIKNSVGNGEAKEHICMSHGHELRLGGGGEMLVGWGVQGRGE